MTVEENNPHEQPGRGLDGWLPVVLLILVQVANGLREIPQFAFFVIYLQDQVHLQPVVISSVTASAQIAGMLTALLGGGLAGRLGSKWVLVGGLALSALGSLALQVQGFWLVTCLWFLGGMGAALFAIGGASYLTQLGGRGSLGVLAAVYALSVTVGGAVGNPVAAWLIERYGYAGFSRAAMALSALVILTVSLKMPRFRSAPLGEAVRRPSLTGVAPLFRQRSVRLVIAMRSLATFFYGMMNVLIPLLIYNLSGSKATVAAYGTATLVVASLVQLLVGRLADRKGARLPSLAAFSAMLLAGLGLSLLGGQLWGLFTFGILGIAAAWSLSTLMYVWVSDGIPRPDHPAAFGLLHAVWSLSMISGSVFGGWFVASVPWLPFLVAGLLNGGAILLASTYYRQEPPGQSSAKAEIKEPAGGN